jgi:hypothetical protein
LAVGAGGVGAVTGEATGTVKATVGTARRSSPFGPAAEATAPKQMVATRAADVAASRATLLRVRVDEVLSC